MEFQQRPDSFYELGMTRGRSLSEYLCCLGFDPAVNEGLEPHQTSRTIANAAFLEWFLDHPEEITSGLDPNNYWESYGYKLREWYTNHGGDFSDTNPCLVDLGCVSGNFILGLYDDIQLLLGFVGEVPQIFGVEQYDLGSSWYKSTWEKIYQTEGIEVLPGNFIALPFEDSQISHLVSVYGVLNYGSSLLGSDFGARKQIQEMRRVAKKGILTLIPFTLKLDGSYDANDLFIIHDPVNNVRARIPVLQIMDEEGLRYSISQNPFPDRGGYYPALCKFWNDLD